MSSSEADPRFDAFAAREPHFAVLTAPRFLSRNLTADTEREFFASGEGIVDWILRVIDAGLVPEFAPMTILEYGCGIGRLALPLARRPGSVIAVDRSPAMLARAREEARRQALEHIEFLDPHQLFTSGRRFDLVVCYHVLQRLRRDDAMALVNRLSALIAPGGVGVFQWPYRSDATVTVRAARWARERLPAANAFANRFRGKDASVPFMPTNLMPVTALMGSFEPPGFRTSHLALEHTDGLDHAVLFAERSATGASRARTGLAPSASPSSAQRAVADADLEAFNRAAEHYFASLPDWDHHLAKPFSQSEETPVLLANLAVVLQTLKLTPGMRVLDFGGGSGWLSRCLTQMGCRVVVLDVSETALRMARELYARQPPIGDQPAPEFLLFDGRRIDLSDGSLDRIVCFDAFHHAPDPRATIAEFGRVLADGGIAAFAEPGPRHAGSPRSQFEAQTYGVVELDVDVHDIWRTAQSSGFDNLSMAVFHEPPFQVSLAEYEQLLAGGPIEDAWLASTRKFLRHVRFFALHKRGAARLDSRTPAGLACDIRVVLESPAHGGQRAVVNAAVTNTGTAAWLASSEARGGVSLGTHLYDASGALVTFDFHAEPLAPAREVPPGETVRVRVTLPPLPAGRHRIEFDCVASQVTWFAQRGSRPAVLELEVE